MAQPFFDQQRQCPIVRRLGIDDAVRLQADLSQSGSVQVGSSQTPEHWARGPSKYPGGKESRRCDVGLLLTAIGHFVHGAERQAAARQLIVDLRLTEGQHP